MLTKFIVIVISCILNKKNSNEFGSRFKWLKYNLGMFISHCVTTYHNYDFCAVPLFYHPMCAFCF